MCYAQLTLSRPAVVSLTFHCAHAEATTSACARTRHNVQCVCVCVCVHNTYPDTALSTPHQCLPSSCSITTNLATASQPATAYTRFRALSTHSRQSFRTSTLARQPHVSTSSQHTSRSANTCRLLPAQNACQVAKVSSQRQKLPA